MRRSLRVWLVFCKELLGLVRGFGPALQNEALPLGVPSAHHMPAKLQHGGIGHPPSFAAQVCLHLLQQQQFLSQTFPTICHGKSVNYGTDTAATVGLVSIISCHLSQQVSQV